jgi:hypothetical protein
MSPRLHQNPVFRGWLGLFGTLALIFLVRQWSRGGADIIASDGVGYFAHLPSLLLDGNADYSNEFARFGRQGRNHWPVGTAILWLPSYLMGHLVALLAGLFGLGWRTDGTGLPEQLACCLASIAMGCAAVAISYSVARRWFTTQDCLLGVTGLLLGSNLVYYLLVEPYMAHAASAFLASVFLAMCCQESPLDARRATQFGLLAGLMALTRPQDGLFLSLPFVLAWLRGQSPRQLWAPLLAAGLVSAALFAPQVLLWQSDSPSASTQSSSKAMQAAGPVAHWVPGGGHNWLSPRLSKTLVGPREGLFLWHPITLTAVAGLVWAALRGHKVAAVGLLGFLIELYVVAGWGGQGQTFGGRMFLCCFPLFVLGQCALMSRLRRALPALAAAVLVLGVLNFWLMVNYRRQMISSNAHPTITEALRP